MCRLYTEGDPAVWYTVWSAMGLVGPAKQRSERTRVGMDSLARVMCGAVWLLRCFKQVFWDGTESHAREPAS